MAWRQERLEEAANKYPVILHALREAEGPTHPRSVWAAGNLAVALDFLERPGEAADVLEPIFAAWPRQSDVPPTSDLVAISARLAYYLVGAGRLDEARTVVQTTGERLQDADGATELMETFCALLDAFGKRTHVQDSPDARERWNAWREVFCREGQPRSDGGAASS